MSKMTQEQLNAIWAKYAPRVKAGEDESGTLTQDYCNEIQDLGGHFIYCTEKDSAEGARDPRESLTARGRVVLDNPAQEELPDFAQVVFWPTEQLPADEESATDDQSEVTEEVAEPVPSSTDGGWLSSLLILAGCSALCVGAIILATSITESGER
jgi:hypothetical protein